MCFFPGLLFGLVLLLDIFRERKGMTRFSPMQLSLIFMLACLISRFITGLNFFMTLFKN